MIIFTDNLNFKNESNFKSLFDYIQMNSIPYIKNTYGDKGIKIAFGNYTKFNQINSYKDLFNDYDCEDLYSFTNNGINYWEIIEGEILCYLMQNEEWYNSEIKYDKYEIFKILYHKNYEDLISNYAATEFWINYWSSYINDKNIYITFGNVLIYSRTLAKLLKKYNIPLFVLEHFTTGNDYYLELKYEHIPNNSIISNNVFFNSINVKYNAQTLNNTWNKFLSKNNKNVQQPNSERKLFFNNNFKTITIFTQVVNDFSILFTNREYCSTVKFYKEIINIIIHNTNFNLLIKTHPYEFKKNNQKKHITYDSLKDYISEHFIDDFNKRILLVEEYNIEEVVNNTDIGLVFNSQSAFDILKNSKPVITFGNAFYSNYGFTFDYKTIDSFKKDLLVNDFVFSDEMNSKFYLFLNTFFEYLVNNNEVNKVGDIFNEINLNRFIYKNTAIPKKVSNGLINTAIPKKVSNGLIKNNYYFENKLINFFLNSKKYKKYGSKKYEKYCRDRESFFLDSNNKYVRIYYRLLGSKL